MFHSLYQLLQARLDAGASYPDAMLPVIILTTVGWLYVVILMSFSETSFVAGIMTFLLYGVLPLSIILYIFDAPRRRRQRALREEEARRNRQQDSRQRDNRPAPQTTGQNDDDDGSAPFPAMNLAGQVIGGMLASGAANSVEHEGEAEAAAETTAEAAAEAAPLTLLDQSGNETTDAACHAEEYEDKSGSSAVERSDCSADFGSSSDSGSSDSGGDSGSD